MNQNSKFFHEEYTNFLYNWEKTSNKFNLNHGIIRNEILNSNFSFFHYFNLINSYKIFQICDRFHRIGFLFPDELKNFTKDSFGLLTEKNFEIEYILKNNHLFPKYGAFLSTSILGLFFYKFRFKKINLSYLSLICAFSIGTDFFYHFYKKKSLINFFSKFLDNTLDKRIEKGITEYHSQLNYEKNPIIKNYFKFEIDSLKPVEKIFDDINKFIEKKI